MKSNTRKATTNKWQRSALALAVASALGLGTNAAFAVAPVVNTYSPADNATGAGTTYSLQLTFDQNVTAITGKNIVIKKSADDSVVETIAADNTSRVSVSGGKATISHAATLGLSTGYYVQIDAGAFRNASVEDYAGIADATTWNFTTVAGATVTSYTPANGATNFPENDKLFLYFSEAMTAAAGKNLTIYKASDNSVVETVAANDTTKVTVSGSTVYVKPAAALAAGGYYVQIDAGAFTGNTSSASYAGIADTTTWAFTSIADTTAPTTTLSPADNASGVTPSANLVLSFNEVVAAVAGKNITIYKSDGTLVETIAANNTGKVTLTPAGFSGNSTDVTINPTADLAFNTAYYVQIDSGAFVDTATTPNAYAGIADATTWNFTTAAGATPTSFSPANGAANFVENANLSLTFGENVTAVTGKNIRVYNSSNTLIETIAANDTTKVMVSSGTVTVNPAANLPAGSYYVQIDAGAFTGNTSGAGYAGIADTMTWAFTSVADTTVPAAYGFTPTDNAAGISPTANLSFSLGEPVTAVAGKNIVIKKSSDNSVVESIAANDTAKVTVSGSKGAITINPTTDLAFGTGYYVQIDSGAFVDTATAPNAYAGIADATTWNFTTAAGATITGSTPTNGAINFSETANLVLNFGEGVTAVTGKNIKIYKASDNSVVETIAAGDTSKVTISSSKGSASVTINPAANLPVGSYYVQIDAGAFTGNTSSAGYAGIADTTTWAFTTVADTAAPTASSYVPADNATAIAPGADLKLYFNEAVTAVAGKNVKIYKASDNALVESIAANDTAKVTVSGSKVTINPAADLALSTGYYMQIDSGAFVDTASTPNPYAGIADATTWNFTTAAGATVTSYYPANGATNFPETAGLVLWLSENVTPVAGKTIRIYKSSDNSLVESIAANDTAKIGIGSLSGAYYLAIWPSATLAPGGYYVQIDAGAAVGAVSGASYAGIADATTWAFTTVADTTAPTVYSLTPSNSATSAQPGANLVVVFSEKVTAVAGKNVTIKKVSDGSAVETIAADDTSKVTVFGGTVTINPAADLAYSTDYYVTIDAGAFVDKATTPNPYAGISSAIAWKFTTQADPTPAYTPPSSGSSSSGTPTTTTVAPGGTSTIGNTSTPVEAGEGSTLTVTDGTSGATINLPTPSTGSDTSKPVTFKIGGMDMGVKPLDSGSVVKTATVKVNGADTTVLTVTAGKAEMKASGTNQPLMALGSGDNAVVVSSSGADAKVTASVDKTTGVTSLTLAA
ncbi:MAG: Ig-like domain-containing protein, partial [Sulfuricella sp.]|nr:Ig-like domain-containing protein [Sulfuricella sp.]